MSKDRIRRMDLVNRYQLGIRQHRGYRSLAILEDRCAVVIASVTDIQAGDIPRRNAAAPTEEPVRNRAEARRADGLDADHSAFTMMMSSSAWLPTMKS